MRFTETQNYWRATFKDSSQFSEFRTIKFSKGLAIVGKNSEGLYVQSILLPKNNYSRYSAKIASYYYSEVF